MAFGQLEPFGADAGYLGHAITASTIANVNRPKGNKAYGVADFMPTLGKKEPQSMPEMIQIVEMFTIGLGGKDLRNKEK